MKELEKVLEDKDFLDLELREGKDYVLECIKNGLIRDINESGIVLYRDYTISQLLIMMSKINTVNGDKDYFDVFNRQLLEIMKKMQSSDIKLKNTSRFIKCDIVVNGAKDRFSINVSRLSFSPILNYNVDGELLYIETNASTSPLETASSLVDFFDKRFLVNQVTNKLVKTL